MNDSDFRKLVETTRGALERIVNEQEDDNEDVDVKEIISDLADAYGKSNEDQGKMVQLLRGLAFSDDPLANKFMKKLDKETTEISKILLGGESEE